MLIKSKLSPIQTLVLFASIIFTLFVLHHVPEKMASLPVNHVTQMFFVVISMLFGWCILAVLSYNIGWQIGMYLYPNRNDYK